MPSVLDRVETGATPFGRAALTALLTRRRALVHRNAPEINALPTDGNVEAVYGEMTAKDAAVTLKRTLGVLAVESGQLDFYTDGASAAPSPSGTR
jgi:hydroxyethylthiazole kinase-like sugar kinase family protein